MRKKAVCVVCSIILFIVCGNDFSTQINTMRPLGPEDLTIHQDPLAEDATPSLTVENFQMTDNDTAEWTRAPYESSFRIVERADNPEDDPLYTVINGGAVPYIDSGYQKALRQEMEGPEDQEMEFMVTDFGLAEKAASFFRFKITTYPDPVDLKIPGYDSTVAIGYAYYGGIAVFIRYENIYIDLALKGFFAEESIANIARSFIDLLFRKAGITNTAVKVRR
ncbi:MAG: hypothetical protein JW913_15875 [Chitinispirillaceae bacterium]|nr:hypothetical protein [Chitinispirillaceae bacterium]